MWVRRALQRAEPGAQPGFKGEPRTGMLGAGLFRANSTKSPKPWMAKAIRNLNIPTKMPSLLYIEYILFFTSHYYPFTFSPNRIFEIVSMWLIIVF
jgi:hypothetical protein